ncbi:MAG: cytochrome c [Pseudomonadota bacterium]
MILPQSLSAQSGETSYQQKCAACHTIGGGRLVGPDLKGVISKRDPSWLIRWIREPDKMLAEGDPIATQQLQEYNGVPMPNLGVSETEAKNIIAYIEKAESGQPATPTVEEKPAQVVGSTDNSTQGKQASDEPITVAKVPTPVVSQPAAPAGDPKTGKALFLGQQSFANGGPACIACHTTSDVTGLGGGTLGPDLTTVHSRFGGNIGLNSVLVSLPFPTMQGVFSKKPVKKDEAAHLTAYFAETNSLTEKPSMDFTISMISIGGFIFLYLLTHLIWRKRLTGVRIPLVGR